MRTCVRSLLSHILVCHFHFVNVESISWNINRVLWNDHSPQISVTHWQNSTHLNRESWFINNGDFAADINIPSLIYNNRHFDAIFIADCTRTCYCDSVKWYHFCFLFKQPKILENNINRDQGKYASWCVTNMNMGSLDNNLTFVYHQVIIQWNNSIKHGNKCWWKSIWKW